MTTSNTHHHSETTRASIGWVKVGGAWHEEVAKRLLGTIVIAVQVRDGTWYDICQVDRR